MHVSLKHICGQALFATVSKHTYTVEPQYNKATKIRLLASHLPSVPIGNSPHGNVINLIISMWSTLEVCVAFSAPIVHG